RARACGARTRPMITTHVPIVFRQCSAKKMAALRVCHKVEIGCLRRSERRTKGNLPGIPDGARRQSAMHISIVRRVLMQVLNAERAIVAALLFEGVNDRWIALQQHTLF